MSMLPLETWSARTFRFDFPVERLPVIVDRLRGAPDRVEAKLRGVPAEWLVRRDGADWSMQEHVGHLRDLDVLHLKRLDEIARGAAELSAHDMMNRATWDANYNARPYAEVLADFRGLRAGLVERLDGLDARGAAASAVHPRLKQPMRSVDVAFFAAEHDDHYLAVIESIRAKYAAASAAR